MREERRGEEKGSTLQKPNTVVMKMVLAVSNSSVPM